MTHAMSMKDRKTQAGNGNNPSEMKPASETQRIDEREERLFRSVDFDNDRAMLPRDLERVLSGIGLRRDDIRLRESMAALEDYIETLQK